MKILVVAPWVPSIVRPRSLGLLERLSRGNDLLIVCAVWNDRDASDLKRIAFGRTAGVRVHRAGSALRAIFSLATRRSLQQAFVDSQKFRNELKRHKLEFAPDVAYFNVIRSAQFADLFSDIPRIIDLDEFRSRYYGLMANRGSQIFWRQVGKTESARMKRAESSVLEVFDRILVSSPTDSVGRPDKVRLVRSPHLLGMAKPHISKQSEDSLVFVGRQSYQANVDAAIWLIRAVMPLVWKTRPTAHLSIVGADPPPALIKLASNRVTITGTVYDVRPYYEQAALSLIPVTMATGVQMKLIESLTLGVATIATPLVAAGAGLTTGRECAVCSTAEEWAGQIEYLLSAPEARSRLGDLGSKWARENNDDNAVDSQFLDAVGDIIRLDR